MSFGTHAVVAFLLTPFIIHSVGNSAFGVWVLVVSLTGYMGLLDLGTRISLPKYVAQYRAQGDVDALNRFVNSLFSILLCLGLGTFLLAILGAVLIGKVFQIPPSLTEIVPIIALIVGANLSLGFPLTIFQGILLGCQRYVLVNIFEVGGVVLRSVLIVFFLKAGYGLLALALITAGVSLGVYCIFVVIVCRLVPEFRLRAFEFTKEELKKIIHFSLANFWINVADRLIFYSGSLIVGYFLSMVAVAFFAIAESLITYMRQAVLALVTVLVPAASEMEANKEFVRLKELTIMSAKVVFLVVLPLGIGGVVVGESFIRLWMGSGYDDSAVVLAILVVGQAVALSQYGPEIMLIGINRHRNLAIVMMIIACINITLSLVFVRMWGLVGVALGCAIPLAIGQLVCVPIFIRKYIGLPISVYVRRAFLPGLAPIVIFALVLWGNTKIFDADSWGGLAMTICVTLIAYIPAIFFLSCNKEEQGHLRIVGSSLVQWR